MTCPLVLVRWHDAWFDYDPPDGGFSASCPASTVGWLIRETDEVVSVAQEQLDQHTFRAVTHIPVSLVEDTTYLNASFPP